MADVKFKGSDYYKIKTFDFRSLLSAEVNELQDIQSFEGQESLKLTVGDGPSGESWKVVIKNSSEISIQPGIFTHGGNVLHLTESVDIEYDDGSQTLSNGFRYIVFCTYKDIEITYIDDPTLKDPNTGETSTRMGREYTFGVHKEWSDVSMGTNYIPLSYFVWKNDDLVAGDLFDLRFKFAQHYVVDGFNVASYTVENDKAVITLENGSLSYLSVFKRLVSPTDDDDLKFEIDLSAVGTQSRYQIGYRLSSYLAEPYNVSKVIVSTLSTSSYEGPFVPLYNITVDSSQAVQSETNDIRRYEPLTRRISSNRSLALADVSFLKPLQAESPDMSVSVNDGWYYHSGVYKTHSKQTIPHGLATTGKHRIDVVGFDSSNSLTLYKGDEVDIGETPVVKSDIPSSVYRIYQVQIAGTTTKITDASDFSDPQTGEIKDLRNLFEYFIDSSGIYVDRSGFSGTETGGLSTIGSGDSLEDTLADIESNLVIKKTFTDSLGITPQDDTSDAIFDDITGKVILGHQTYISGNTDNSTKVGIKVSRDQSEENKIVIENTWDPELRQLTSQGVLPATMHTHPGEGALEHGSPIIVKRKIIENRDEERVAFISDFVLDEVQDSPFMLIPTQGGIPAHIGLNINTTGGVELTEDGFTVKVDKTKGLKSTVDGLGVYAHTTQSGITFIDDGGGDYYIKLSLNQGFSINNENKLTLDLDGDGGLTVGAGGFAVGDPIKIVEELQGLGTSPSDKLIVKTTGALEFTGGGDVTIRTTDFDGGPKESFLEEEGTTTGSKTLLKVKIDSDGGLHGVGGELAVKTGSGLELSGGSVVLKTSDLVAVAGDKGIIENAGKLELKLNTSGSLIMDVNGLALAVDTNKGLVINPGGIAIDLKDTDPALEFDGNELAIKMPAVETSGLVKDGTGLNVKLDPNGGLEHTTNGVRVEGLVTNSGTAYLFGGLDVGLGAVSEELFSYDINDKTFSSLVKRADEAASYGSKGAGSFVVGANDLHLFSGQDFSGTETGIHCKYDIGTGILSVVSPSVGFDASFSLSLALSSTVGLVLEGTDTSRLIRKYTTTGGWVTLTNTLNSLGAYDDTSWGPVGDSLDSTSILYTPGQVQDTVPGPVFFSSNFYEVNLNGVNPTEVSSINTLTTAPSPTGYGYGAKIEATARVTFVGGEDDSVHYSETFTVDSAGLVVYRNRIPYHKISRATYCNSGNTLYVFGGNRAFDEPVDNILSYDNTVWKYEGKTLSKNSNGTGDFN